MSLWLSRQYPTPGASRAAQGGWLRLLTVRQLTALERQVKRELVWRGRHKRGSRSCA